MLQEKEQQRPEKETESGRGVAGKQEVRGEQGAGTHWSKGGADICRKIVSIPNWGKLVFVFARQST